jgi:hypothetical protein
MGIDYDGVGGIGIELTEELVQRFIAAEYFTEEEWQDDYEDCLETIGKKFNISFTSAGNFYSGDIVHYLLVDGENLKEINENSKTFIEKLKIVGIELSEESLKVISDYKVW